MTVKLCEACGVPLTEQEQADYVSLCEVCGSTIDHDTELYLEEMHFDPPDCE